MRVLLLSLFQKLKFLRGLDVEKLDMGYVLMKYSELLGFKPEGTMSTSVAYLVSTGVNPRDIGPMVTQYPYFLGMRTMIKPLVDYLVSLGLPEKVLARMFEIYLVMILKRRLNQMRIVQSVLGFEEKLLLQLFLSTLKFLDFQD